MAEYINMITVSSVAATLFFGGWSFFGLTDTIPVLPIIIFMIKVAVFLFFFIWLRATLPRIRYDRLMQFGWTTLLPLAVLNIVVTAICVALNWYWWVNGLIGLLIIVVMLYQIQRQGLIAGTRYEEATEKGIAVLPTSVRLAKFENAAPAITEENHQEQDTKAVPVA